MVNSFEQILPQAFKVLFFTLEHHLTNVKRVFIFKLPAMWIDWISRNLCDHAANANSSARSEWVNF